MPNWENTVTVTVPSDGEIMPVQCPGRCNMDRVSIVRINGGGPVTIKFYNRAFTNTPQPRVRIYKDPNSVNCMLKSPLFFKLKVGDVVTVTGAANAGYNVQHRAVLLFPDDKTFITDQVYDQDDVCTAQLTIPTAEQPAYSVLKETSSENSTDVLFQPPVGFVNQDPPGNITNRGVPRFLYIQFGNAGTYRISIRARID